MTTQLELVFAETVNVLHQDGWTQGTEVDAAGRRCAIGALRKACAVVLSGSEWRHAMCTSDASLLMMRATEVVAGVLRRHGYQDRYCHSLVSWNDHPGRHADEVVHLFKECGEFAAMAGGGGGSL